MREGGAIAGLIITYAESDDGAPARVKQDPPPKPRVRSCVAQTQDAVREAARRAWALEAEGALETVFTRMRP